MSPEVEALYNWVNDAMNVRNAQPDAMVASDPFLRNERTARHWLQAAKKLFEPVAGLRSAAHTEETAWRFVADSAASEDEDRREPVTVARVTSSRALVFSRRCALWPRSAPRR